MNILTDQQVRKLIKQGRDSSLSEAIKYEQRMRLHTEVTTKETKNPAYNSFLIDLPNSILPDDKYNTFRSLVTWPLPTIEVTDSAYSELKKVFEGQDKVAEIKFKNEEFEVDFEKYRSAIKEQDFWANQGWNIFKLQINSVIGVDIKSLGLQRKDPDLKNLPEPYFFSIETEDVVAIKNDHEGNCKYIIFKEEPGHELRQRLVEEVYYQYDSQYYRRYLKVNGNIMLDVEVTHDLGYCPARQFYNNSMGSDGDCFLKQNPVTPNLGQLDWLLFQIISGRHLDLYGSYPVISMYEQKCNYETEDGFTCESGYIHRYLNPGTENERIVAQTCPHCKGKQLVGPGSILIAPARASNEDPDMMPVLQITGADIASVDSMDRKIEALKSQFMRNVLGSNNEPVNDAAKNEKQIGVGVESKQTVIIEVKTKFEEINKWVLKTLAKLRYGDDYISCSLSYGTKFFLQSNKEMLSDYQSSKSAGIPVFELENMRRNLFAKKYSANPELLSRIMILDHLEPLPDISLSEMQSFASIISRKDMALKLNFNDAVAWFEREWGSVTQFMPSAKFSDRIEFIKIKLNEYVEKILGEAPMPIEEGANEQ